MRRESGTHGSERGVWKHVDGNIKRCAMPLLYTYRDNSHPTLPPKATAQKIPVQTTATCDKCSTLTNLSQWICSIHLEREHFVKIGRVIEQN